MQISLKERLAQLNIEALGEIVANLRISKYKNVPAVLHELVTDSDTQFEMHKEMIAKELPAILADIKAPETNLKQINSWDEYLISFITGTTKKLEELKTSFKQTLKKAPTEDAELKDFLVDKLTNLVEGQTVRHGVGTAINFISGIFRVIPKLWKTKYQSNINKTTFIELFNKSRDRLNKWAKHHIKEISMITGAMPLDPKTLSKAQMPDDDDFKKATDFEKNYPEAEQPKLALFHPEHFMLNKHDKLALSSAGQSTIQRAVAINRQTLTEKVHGCPALDVEIINPLTQQKQKAIDALCDTVTNIINLIPDQEFNRLVAA